MVWLPVFATFNMCTYVDVWNYTREQSLHWKLTLGEKSLAAPGTRTRISIAPGVSARHSTS